MEKTFGDLKRGDKVWIADFKEWKVNPVKIIEIVAGDVKNYVWIYLDRGKTNFRVNKESDFYGSIEGGVWVNYKESVKVMLEIAKKKDEEYVKKIDALISEYDALQKFVRENG